MKAFEESKYFDPPTSIYKIVSYAEPIVSIGNQTGEGWFLTGEMVELIKEGVPNIVCTQPFGCLPNHVVGKGVIKALRKAYPSSNIVAIDYDPGASEVNQLNRIKLMLSTAHKNLKKGRGCGISDLLLYICDSHIMCCACVLASMQDAGHTRHVGQSLISWTSLIS